MESTFVHSDILPYMNFRIVLALSSGNSYLGCKFARLENHILHRRKDVKATLLFSAEEFHWDNRRNATMEDCLSKWSPHCT